MILLSAVITEAWTVSSTPVMLTLLFFSLEGRRNEELDTNPASHKILIADNLSLREPERPSGEGKPELDFSIVTPISTNDCHFLLENLFSLDRELAIGQRGCQPSLDGEVMAYWVTHGSMGERLPTGKSVT